MQISLSLKNTTLDSENQADFGRKDTKIKAEHIKGQKQSN